ncbi:ATP-binding protein [Planctomycetales bacterium ZRK34]|nr:ATP-binding protein [Planctomycetales bacterium ZRK34]
MDIVKLARKLKPLMPKEVGHWLSIHKTADPELRTLIERQIVHAAQARLGDYEDKILLSLPPRKVIGGELNLGTILYDKDQHPAGISLTELTNHLAVYGRSGAGKTNAVFHLLQQLTKKRVSWIFLDWKRTGRHALGLMREPVDVYTPGRSLSPLQFNPFMPPPQEAVEPKVYLNQVVDIMASAFTLGDGAKRIIQQALFECYESGNLSPSPQNVLERVQNVPDSERVKGWKVSAVRALESLDFAEMGQINTASQRDVVDSFFRGRTIIELNGLSDNVKAFLVPVICQWLFYSRLGHHEREKLRLVIVIEEAHHVLYRGERRTRETVMNTFLRQCRELGLGVIIVDQHPHLISPVASNTFATMCFNLKDPSDLNRTAGMLGLDDDEKHHLGNLPVGQAICKFQDRWRGPFLIQLPLMSIPKGWMTDDRLKAYLAGKLPRSGRMARQAPNDSHVLRVLGSVGALDGEQLRFVEDVLRYPDSTVRQRYRRLGIGGGKGDRTKAELVAAGWLEQTLVPQGQTRRLVLGLTSRAAQQLNLEGAEITPGSLPHRYWTGYYADWLSGKGYDVQCEAPIGGGRVDVLAQRNNKIIAVEVETGKSDVVRNVRGCLKAKMKTIVIVAVDENALNVVHKQLGRAGLLITGRVKVVLRDEWARSSPPSSE